MFLAVHATVGALIGARIPNPALSFILSFISHFVLDLIPHGDETLGEEFHQGKRKILFPVIVGCDVIVMIAGVILNLLYAPPAWILSVSFGIVGALLPDVLQTAYLFSKHSFFKGFFDLHAALHYKKGRFSMPLYAGIILQICLLVLLLLLFK